jgi:glycosyltransferase involved in cell wall biosynthesis
MSEQVATTALSVLHVVASINPNTGGPAASVTGLVGALVRCGVGASLAALDYAEHGNPIAVDDVRLIQVAPGAMGKRLRGWSPSFEVMLFREAQAGLDLIHNHGIWMYPGIYARRVATQSGIPLVISPRGMLDPWALRRAPIRKALAAALYERTNLRTARAFHATSDLEADAIRSYGLRQPIAVIPNGVEIPDASDRAAREALEGRYPQLRDRRWLLFLGRIHPKKGIDMLLEAWRNLHPEFPSWHLIVAGPDLANFGAELATAVRRDGRTLDGVTFVGMLKAGLKRSALDNASLFVLPTRSENFGIAIAEALAAGIPVVTTTAAPWSHLASLNCGWWVASETAAIANALREGMAKSAPELEAMGKRGREFVSKRYAWEAIGEQMADVYRWLIDGGCVPPCVREA